MKQLLFSILFVFVIKTVNISAQVIGRSWEFSENGNSEGWEANASLTELLVEHGMLKTSVTARLAAVSGPEVNFAAEDYGFILIRMKAIGTGTGKFYWKTDSYSSKRMTFAVQSDSLFHEYEIPLHTSQYWAGTVLQIIKLSLDVPVGTEIFIDYIRIVTIGARFAVDLKPLRTVLKKDLEIPIVAIITNSGDAELAGYTAELELPEEWILKEGYISQQGGSLNPSGQDTLIWTVVAIDTGFFLPKIRLTSDSVDTREETFDAVIANKYWVQKEFALSAWSPPVQTEDAYTEYADANFDLIAYCSPQQPVVDYISDHNMQCMLNVGPYISGDFRAPDNRPVEPISENDLIGLDPIIQTFLEHVAPIGYHICDEPNAYAFSNLEKIVEYLRKRDPERVAYINLFPTYANATQLGTKTYDEHVRQFVEIVKPELISYDHYNFFVENRDGFDYFQNLEIIRKYALLYDIPFWNIIQAINSQVRTDVWRKLHHGEYRWLVYSSLAYGARGIFYFAWSGSYGIMTAPEKEEAYVAIQSLNLEVKKLGPILMNLKSTEVYHLNIVPLACRNADEMNLVSSTSIIVDVMIGEFQDVMNQDYFMLMNKDYNQNISTQVMLNRSVSALDSYDLETQTWQPVVIQDEVDGTSFDFQALPGGGSLYRLGNEINVDQFVETAMAKSYILKQNYPNPFNPTTTIHYQLNTNNHVQLFIYDITGREVAQLVDVEQKAGDYRIVWDAKMLPSGVYICRLEAGSNIQTLKMFLLK